MRVSASPQLAKLGCLEVKSDLIDQTGSNKLSNPAAEYYSRIRLSQDQTRKFYPSKSALTYKTLFYTDP